MIDWLKRNRWLICGICFISIAVLYVLAEALAASAWTDPKYDYARNYISDLGVSVDITVDGRVISSPLYWLMNAALIIHGVILFAACLFLRPLLPKWGYPVIIAFGLLHAAGVTVSASVHGVDYHGLNPHVLGAIFAILFGNVFAIAVSGFGCRRLFRGRQAALGILFGVFGIAGGLILQIDSIVYKAVFERLSVYPIMAFDILIGLTLIVKHFAGRKNKDKMESQKT